jgi:uncharacterized membrane protein YoaK (UPF0700 family)
VNRYDQRVWLLAACLSALAGYVDAIGFVELGGFFVSFMSGNSTRLGVGVVESAAAWSLAAGLIAAFVLGVLAGSLTGRAIGHRRRAAVLALVTVLLAAAALMGSLGYPLAAAAFMAMAMGAENTVFERDGEVSIGLTYMTGTLVKLGQRVAAAALGGDRLGWLPYLILWLGLVVGAVGGALSHARIGLAALWGAVVAAALIAAAAARLKPGRS